MQRIKRICYAAALMFTATLMGRVAVADEPPPQQPDMPTESPPPKPADKSADKPADKPSDTKPSDITPSDTRTGDSKVMAQKQSMTATVQKVDMKHRQVMLKDDQGMAMKVDVPEDVKGVDKLKKGDKVAIDYYQSLVLSMAKPGSKMGESSSKMEQKTPGPMPNGMMAKQIKATVEVVNADASNNKLTIKTPSGDLDTLDVSDPALQGDLAKLKKGDKIQVNYTSAVAISVTPQGDANKAGGAG